MKNRRKDNKPTEDTEDVTSWELPSQVGADDLTSKEPSTFFEPPAGLPPTVPPELPADMPSTLPPDLPPVNTALPSLPPPPPAPEIPTVNEPTVGSWSEAAPSAEVRDFPPGASTASPYRPDLPEPGALIDLTSRTEHPYDDIYSISQGDGDQADHSPGSSDDTETIDLEERLDLTTSRSANEGDQVRELPQDLRSALQIATTPALGLPQIDLENDVDVRSETSPVPASTVPASTVPVSTVPAPPTAQASAMAQIPTILTVDVLGDEPPNLGGLFTDVLTDNGFDVNSVSETSILLTRDNGTVTIDRAEASDGCIVEVAGLPATAVKKLLLAGLLQIGYEIQASRPNETVLRDHDKSLARIVHI